MDSTPQGPGWDGDPTQRGGPVPPPPSTPMPPPAPRPTSAGGALTGDGARPTVGPQAIPPTGATAATPGRQLVEPPPPPRDGANPWLIAAIAIGTVVLLAGAGGWYLFLRSPGEPVKVETAASSGTSPKGTQAPSATDRTSDTEPSGTSAPFDEGSGTTVPEPPSVDVPAPSTTQAPSSGGGGGGASSGGGNSGGNSGGGNNSGGNNNGGGNNGGNNGGGGGNVVTTTQTTQAPPPKINSFTAKSTQVFCSTNDLTTTVDLAWDTSNTREVSLTSDSGTIAGFQPKESASIEVNCKGSKSPVVTLTAKDAAGRVVTQKITLQVVLLQT